MKTMLLAEDNAALRELLQEALKSKYHILSASDGREALALFRQHSGEVDILLVDAGLPYVSGWELASILDGVRPQIKCLVMSGDADSRSTTPHRPSRWWFISKPFSLRELSSAIERVLNASEQSGAVGTELWDYLNQKRPHQEAPPPKNPGTVAAPVSRRASNHR